MRVGVEGRWERNQKKALNESFQVFYLASNLMPFLQWIIHEMNFMKQLQELCNQVSGQQSFAMGNNNNS
jgi:hypothetical protein